MKTIPTIAFALALAGCVSPSVSPPSPVSPVSVLPEQVQSAVQAACGVVLTAQSLSAVISMLTNVDVSNLTGTAAQVCNAVLGKSGRVVAGGVVRGVFRGRMIQGTRV